MGIEYSEEVLMLAGIREGNSEPEKVVIMRQSFAVMFDRLVEGRELAGRSEAGKAFNIAITQLRLSRSITIEALYLSLN